MGFQEQRAAALELLASKGLPRASYSPTLVRALWRLGLEIPPPHFAGFGLNGVVFGGLFGVAWGLILWFAIWSRRGVDPRVALSVTGVVALVFGLGMASYFRFSARKHALPPWDQLAGRPGG